jgi:hypothetical protein
MVEATFRCGGCGASPELAYLPHLTDVRRGGSALPTNERAGDALDNRSGPLALGRRGARSRRLGPQAPGTAAGARSVPGA